MRSPSPDLNALIHMLHMPTPNTPPPLLIMR